MALVFHDGSALVVGDAIAITQNGSATLRLAPAQVIPHDQVVDLDWRIYPRAVITLGGAPLALNGDTTLRLTPAATIALGPAPGAAVTQDGDTTLRLTPAAVINVGVPSRPPIDIQGGAVLRLTAGSAQGPGGVWVRRVITTTTWIDR